MGRNKRLALAFWKSIETVPAMPPPRPMMTMERFGEALAATPYRWELLNERIRTVGHPPDCPLAGVACYLTGTRYLTNEWDSAAQAIGLSFNEAKEVVHAADNADGCDAELRKRLLIWTKIVKGPVSRDSLDTELAALVADAVAVGTPAEEELAAV